MSTLLRLADELERRSKDYERIHEGLSRSLQEVAYGIRAVVPNPDGIRTDTKCLQQEGNCKAADCPEHGIFLREPSYELSKAPYEMLKVKEVEKRLSPTISIGESQQEARVIASYQKDFEEAFKRGLETARRESGPVGSDYHTQQLRKIQHDSEDKMEALREIVLEPPTLPGPPGRHTTMMNFFESVARMNEEARFKESDLDRQEGWRLERLEQLIQEGISTLTDVSRVVRYHLDKRTQQK